MPVRKIAVNFRLDQNKAMSDTLDALKKQGKKFKVVKASDGTSHIEADDKDADSIMTALGGKGMKTQGESVEDLAVKRLLEGENTAKVLASLEGIADMPPQTLQEGIGSTLLALAGATIAAQKIKDMLAAQKELEDLQKKLNTTIENLNDVVKELEALRS